jgi:NCAIR mutase (PurE)-related protein
MKAFEVDHDRLRRVGFPEIIYGRSKTIDSLKDILNHYVNMGENALVTKLQPEKGKVLVAEFKGSFYDPVSGVFMLQNHNQDKEGHDVAILSGGTSDLFVVNEVFYTLTFLGHSATRMVDIGVAGIHRLLSKVDDLKGYKVLIAVAGFEGALPTVTGGLLPQPIIAVPTSVGYGVSADGKAALSTMLSSCSNGITVVNIDNGYGAAMAAVRILNMLEK